MKSGAGSYGKPRQPKDSPFMRAEKCRRIGALLRQRWMGSSLRRSRSRQIYAMFAPFRRYNEWLLWRMSR